MSLLNLISEEILSGVFTQTPKIDISVGVSMGGPGFGRFGSSKDAIEAVELSRYEREQLERRQNDEERAWHAFASDEGEWGWFDPAAWYAGCEGMRAAGV